MLFGDLQAELHLALERVLQMTWNIVYGDRVFDS